MAGSLAQFFGDGNFRIAAADTTIERGQGRCQAFRFTSAGLVAVLPDARFYGHAGGPVFILLNLGAFDFDVEDLDGAYVGTVEAGRAGTVLLSSVASRSGHWHMMVRDFTLPSDGTVPGTPTPMDTPTPPTDPTITPTPTGSYGVTSGQIQTNPIPLTTGVQ